MWCFRGQAGCGGGKERSPLLNVKLFPTPTHITYIYVYESHLRDKDICSLAFSDAESIYRVMSCRVFHICILISKSKWVGGKTFLKGERGGSYSANYYLKTSLTFDKNCLTFFEDKITKNAATFGSGKLYNVFNGPAQQQWHWPLKVADIQHREQGFLRLCAYTICCKKCLNDNFYMQSNSCAA